MDTQRLQRASAALLWLLTINLGIALGAGLYESRVVVSGWPGVPPSEWPNTGLLFWVYVTTVPLTLLTILNGVAAWKDRSVRRQSWLTAVAILVCERLATFGYFIPTMVGLMESATLDAQAAATLTQWMTLNYGRHVLTFAALFFAMRALATPVASAATVPQGQESPVRSEAERRPMPEAKTA